MDYIGILFIAYVIFVTDGLPIVINAFLGNITATEKMKSKNGTLTSKKKLKFTSLYLFSVVWIILVSLGFVFYWFLYYLYSPKIANHRFRKKSSSNNLRRGVLFYRHINLRYRKRKFFELRNHSSSERILNNDMESRNYSPKDCTVCWQKYKCLNASNSRTIEGDQLSCEEEPKSGFCCCGGKKKTDSMDDTINKENAEVCKRQPKTGGSPRTGGSPKTRGSPRTGGSPRKGGSPQRQMYAQPVQYQPNYYPPPQNEPMHYPPPQNEPMHYPPHQNEPVMQQPMQKRLPPQAPLVPVSSSQRISQVHPTFQETSPQTPKNHQSPYTPEENQPKSISPPQHLQQPISPRPVSNIPPAAGPSPQAWSSQQPQQPQHQIQFQPSHPPPPPQPRPPQQQMPYQSSPPIRQQQQPMYQNPPAPSPRSTPQRGATTQKTSTSIPIQSYGGSSNMTSDEEDKTSPGGCCAAKKKSVGVIHPQIQAYKVEGHLRVKGKVNKETISIPSDTYLMS